MKIPKKRLSYLPPKEDRPGSEFYKKNRWRKLSERFRVENPLCHYHDTVASSQVVDHLRPRRLWPNLEWDESNFRACCYLCHQKKSALESNINSQNEWETKMKDYL